MSSTPGLSGAERTTTVVIGTGLPGLAIATELCRRGVDAIIVSGLESPGTGDAFQAAPRQRRDAPGTPSREERNEILRQLRNYASSHHLDIRNDTSAVLLDKMGADASLHRWAVHTPDGVLLADHIVLTRCANSQLRRMLTDLGISVGQNLVAAMRAIGIYLVGVGELVTPTPREVLRQAKAVGQAISAKVNPDSVPSVLTGSFAALPAPL
ncbi:MAG: FAD-binding protein [Arthrobacter sp.]|nr:FAD-binding protein [Arthrobacter sp.]MCE3244064.1 FAD-binding protein [Arthrobacter sp.]MCE3291461.1 FAD-binding protein [Arthrobacter sp.]